MLLPVYDAASHRYQFIYTDDDCSDPDRYAKLDNALKYTFATLCKDYPQLSR